ncbi:hypothetical protein CHUAL_005912 [Chamberlinius hualienensis]
MIALIVRLNMATASTTSTEDNINILILGESGVGKSTFINAFANYVTFDEPPIKFYQKLVSLIPTSFTIYDENNEQSTITFGQQSKLHNFEIGEAATRFPCCYEFPLGDKKIRIIDTPGIGDPDGINKDRENFDNILSFISTFDNLHCICILLKPNCARLTITFDFCIKQLLCHLHKDASKNIVFVYTHSRSTFYRPGDTGPILKKMLVGINKRPPYVTIPDDSKRVYCLDNEAFRFILAIHQGVRFDNETKKDFSASWNKSAKECQRLMKYIIGFPEEDIYPLPPHNIKDTVSLNKARTMIMELSKPLTDIMENVSHNIAALNKHKQTIEENSENLRILETKLYVPTIRMEVVSLEKPHTICTTSECSELVSVGGVKCYTNKKRCDDNMGVISTILNLFGYSGTRWDSAMNYITGNCNFCGCSYERHIHKNYEIQEVVENTIDEDVQIRLDAEIDARKRAEEILSQTENRINEYTREKEILTKSTATFTHFLRNNSIISYNDAFTKYINYQIENLEANGEDKGELVKELKDVMEKYENNIQTLESTMSNANNDESKLAVSEITADDVIKTIEELKKLPICGAKILELQAAQDKMFKQVMRQRIVSVKEINPNQISNFLKKSWEKSTGAWSRSSSLFKFFMV